MSHRSARTTRRGTVRAHVQPVASETGATFSVATEVETAYREPNSTVSIILSPDSRPLPQPRAAARRCRCRPSTNRKTWSNRAQRASLVPLLESTIEARPVGSGTDCHATADDSLPYSLNEAIKPASVSRAQHVAHRIAVGFATECAHALAHQRRERAHAFLGDLVLVAFDDFGNGVTDFPRDAAQPLRLDSFLGRQ